jgi:hypothetical protein
LNNSVLKASTGFYGSGILILDAGGGFVLRFYNRRTAVSEAKSKTAVAAYAH